MAERKEVYMSEEEFAFYYDKYYVTGKMIQRIARKYSGNNEDAFDDLVSVGLERLARLHPSRARKNVDSWIRNALRNSMIDHLRHENPKIYDSLDSRLLHGEQLEQDSNGDIQLVNSRRDLRKAITQLQETGAMPDEEQDTYE